MPPTTSSPPKPAEQGEKTPAKAAGSSGGIKPWLPVIANVVLMPVLAYATVTFLILPRINPGSGALVVSAKTSAGTARGSAAESKTIAPLGGKVLVNVAGTMGTRYVVASMTLVGTGPELKELVEKNDAELRNEAAGALSVKTIADLEKAGARNLIRTELISIFNNVLGEGIVTDVYLTDFAIQ